MRFINGGPPAWICHVSDTKLPLTRLYQKNETSCWELELEDYLGFRNPADFRRSGNPVQVHPRR